MNELVHLYVSLERDARGYPPFEVEEIDGSLVDGDRYRIEGVPVFVHGMARGDIVRVVRLREDESLWVEETVEPSAHWTARVLPWDATQLSAIAEEFRKLGCDAHATRFGLVAVDVPETVPAALAMEALRRGADARRWDFDLGVSPPGHTGG